MTLVDGWYLVAGAQPTGGHDDDGTTILYEDTHITDPSEILDVGENYWVQLPTTVNGRYVEVQTDGYNLGPEEHKGLLCITGCRVGDVVYYGYSQVATATLGMELDPTGELCDKLVVGVLDVSGTLEVTSLGGSFAGVQVYDLFDWDTLVGTFDTVNLPTLSGSLSWDTSNLYVTGELSVSSAQIPGDADEDGDVDKDDLQRLALNWGATTFNPTYSSWWQMGDFDGDEVVGPKDASILAGNFGYPGSEATGVPEPGALAMLLMGVASLLARARGRRHLS